MSNMHHSVQHRPLLLKCFLETMYVKRLSLTKGQKVAALVSSENSSSGSGYTSRGRGGNKHRRRGGFRARLVARGRNVLGRKSAD